MSGHKTKYTQIKEKIIKPRDTNRGGLLKDSEFCKDKKPKPIEKIPQHKAKK